MALDPDQHRLPEDEHQAIFEKEIIPALFDGTAVVQRPVAVILGGQPGAGKSPLVEAATVELMDRGGVAEIVGDDLRDFHPRYRSLLQQDDRTAAFYTDRDSGRWVEKAIEQAKARSVNLIIEGTMRRVSH
jgi:Ni2+-binding GTPase involved in maturation of urease and hydrogenase